MIRELFWVMDNDWRGKVLEKNDKEEIFEAIDELKVGMEVSNEAEAYNLCNIYAFKKGFSIRKGNIRRDSHNNVRQRDFFCSKEGFQPDEDLCEVKKVRRLDTRTGCKAMIRFTVDNGVWKISHLIPDHNHEFARPEERQFLRSGRHIPGVRAALVSSMVDGSPKLTQSYSLLGKESGSTENVGSTNKGCHNCLQRKNEEMLEGRDGQSLLNYFRHKQAEDPNFFYSVQVDQFNRATNFFWRDSRSKLDYDCFGDAVCFDTTFRTRKYNLICAPFLGVNHHCKNVLFGCAFMSDVSADSITWLLETFMVSMGNKQPKTIFTDEDIAMGNAMVSILPETRHRLCIWHISKNAAQYLGSHSTNPEFKEHFNKCFHDCLTEAEFEATWNDMIIKFNLEGNAWLKKLYSLREKWCPAFSLDTYTANIRSPHRGESITGTFHQVSTKTMDLIGLVHHYEKKTRVLRTAELEEDFRCKNGTPHLRVNSGIFKHASAEYTVKMYSYFENELMSIFAVRMIEVGNDGNQYIYEAIEEGNQRAYMIDYNSTTAMVSCSCKLFESMGILCRHSLKVLDLKNFTCLPPQYIMKRWTKGAKKRVAVSGDSFESYKTGKSSQSSRLSSLMHEANNVFSVAALCDSGTRIVRQKLEEAIKLLESDEVTTSMVGNLSKVDD
ncbi:unnamed protein product [Malus baccata var. baccata]